jgi:hypothetical protein
MIDNKNRMQNLYRFFNTLSLEMALSPVEICMEMNKNFSFRILSRIHNIYYPFNNSWFYRGESLVAYAVLGERACQEN